MNPAPQLYNEVLKIAAAPDPEPRAQVQALSVLMERLLMEATKAEQIAFSTLFARICYVGHRHSFQTATLQVLHAFRRVAARTRQGHSATAREVRLGVKALSETILVLYQTALPPELLPLLPPDGEWDFQPPDIWDFKALARVVALRDEPDHHRLVVVDEDDPAREVYVLYNLPDRNDNFRPTIELIRKVFGCPLTLHLLEVEIDRDGCYRPRGFVLEPDYLLDVSAVAECFKDTGPEPLSYLVRKFLPRETTVPLHLGNVANFFLDRLLNEPEASFPDLFRETFRNSPFVYAPMTDAEVREISQQAQKHYVTLRAMTAGGGLAKEGIDPEHSVLEPSFFSQQYGLQGRLDLFYRTEERAAIVELKSGKPFKPNRHGIARSHFTQTLLYDLLVRSVYGKQTDPTKYILYSAEPERPLRFAPTVEAEQWEALQVRNQLVGIERLLCDIRPGQLDVPILNRIRASGVAGKGFLERDFGTFEQRYRSFSVVQKKYFNAFAGFVAREQWLAKVGVHDVDNDYGHAALWRNHFAEKQAAFSILSHLAIADNQADQPDPFILFRKTEGTHPLANFRVGDIGVLYPLDSEGDTILHHQIIKCTITHLSTTEVRVQLRSRQFNLQPFNTEALWCLEPDLMEASFGMMQQAVFENPVPPLAPPLGGSTSGVVAGAAEPLNNAAANPSSSEDGTTPPLWGDQGGLTHEQAHLLDRITQSQNYFLLWGPPGTGKTSVMLRELAGWVLNDTSDNLLLLAYTNRAVDEICEALDSLGGDIREQYLRIGSRFSTAPVYREQLLNEKIAASVTRAELRAVLDRHRIFVSTVASFSQNENLLKIKTFQRLVVDEASQILEPQIVGLLRHFEHWTLIGDHRQLPAVTAQAPEWTRVDDPDLNAIGLRDLRESYFERLYRHCESTGERTHLGCLSAQGRMCEPLMEFPNEHFYGGLLELLDPEQQSNIAPTDVRVRFVATPPADPTANLKTNRQEAERVAELVLEFKQLWQQQGRSWHPAKTLGIITPWRAQIAQIRASLHDAGLDPDEVTIDTVERYQGGARDVILISTCVSSAYQLRSLVSLSDEGVDRKLNVALTRARQHLVLLGNPDLLRLDDRYRAFIDRYRVD